MKNIYFLLSIILFIGLQACGWDKESNVEIVVPPYIGELIDVDLALNQVRDFSFENNVGVGLTAVVDDYTHPVTYQLLGSAEGRFSINEKTGVVLLIDYLLLNANLKPSHTIYIQATNVDGTKTAKAFEIAVIGQSHFIDKIPSSNYENDIPIVSKYYTLFDWDAGEGVLFSGWTWHDDIAYGNPGWLLDDNVLLGGGEQYKWGWGARSFNKADYGKDNTAIVDVLDKAPTSTGGSLKVLETEDSTDHRSTWWLWYDGKPLSERGITDSNTDRMSFYLKTEGMAPLNDDGGKESLKINFHIGTYLCWNHDEKAWGQGDGCPYEGVGNQHYYHTLSINSGAWIHVLLDQHPQHLRNRPYTLKNNPTKETHNKNYFEQLSRFYFEIRNPQTQKTSFNVDELNYYSTLDMVEPNQNEESITSLWVGFWPDNDVWEIGFHDESYEKYNDDSNSTYEIRWSISPITNENFNRANVIWPQLYGGVDIAGKNSENLIRRANGWGSHVWTRFQLPNNIENNYKKLFFAVKDVSVAGSHIGNVWPYKKGDGHDAPSENIKIIDYHLPE